MMPDLGKYAQAVLSSYAVSIALLVVLVAMSVWRARKTRRELTDIEQRVRRDGYFGKNCLNSPYNCAAKVLLWQSTSVGRLISCTTLATVKVFPLPVTPNKVWCLMP